MRVAITKKYTGLTYYRLTGKPTNPAWKGNDESWCEVSVADHSNQLGSFGGSVWPSAWPEYFEAPKERTCNNVGVVLLTDAGKALLSGGAK